MLLTIVRIIHDDARWRLARVVSLVAGERIVLRSLARRSRVDSRSLPSTSSDVAAFIHSFIHSSSFHRRSSSPLAARASAT
jgi:hypothetical protein